MENHQLLISQWLEQIGKERHISLALEEDGHCLIPCINELNCIVEVPADIEAPTVFLYLPLAPLPDNLVAQLALTRTALEMNLFGRLTGDCQIALDSRSSYLVLSFSAMINALDSTLFRHTLNNMLELAPRLQQRLQNT